MVKYFALSLSMFFSVLGFTQSASNYFVDNTIGSSSNDGSLVNKAKADRLPIHFGVQVRSVLPTKFIQNSATTLSDDGFQTTLKQSPGFGFGASLRVGLTDMLALETGLNFTQRHYDLNVAVPSSNIEGSESMSFVNYDVPINALIYVPLSEKFIMNTAIGVAINYSPSDTRVRLREQEDHYFTLFGVRDNKIAVDLNASLGCEYRTDNSGFFYLGASARIPISPLFNYAAFYDHGGNSTILIGEVQGSFLTLDFKYFFPMRKK